MAKILGSLLILISSFSLQAQPKFTALEITPAYPTAGSKVNFNYNKSYGPLVKEKNLEVVIYQINGSDFKIVEPKITVKNNMYSGSITVNPETSALLFAFNSGDLKDNDKNKGYIVPVYDKNNQPIKGYYLSAANLQNGMGNYLAGIDNNAQAGMDLMEVGLKKFPELNMDNKFFNAYLSATNSMMKKDANPVIIAHLQKLADSPNLTEELYGTLSQWYGRLKDKENAEKYRNLQHEKFPNGDWLISEQSLAINKEKSAAKKEAMLADYINKYGSDKSKSFIIGNLKSQVATAYGAEKNYEQLKKYASQLDPSERAALYNNLSWNMAENDEAMQVAEEMSKEAYNFASAERIKATQEKPDNFTTKQWAKQLENNKAMYGDTYAFILYKKGDFKLAYPIAMEAAKYNKFKIAATIMNEKAPDFKLKDFDGNFVSLADMKGKIVILDFWATWCGPCIASMPGMNLAINQYKDRDDVKFLFVDTWENVENKLENAKTFMEKKNYPFHVIMDNDDIVVADYKVSGIPTKFIIDKKGNIRFKPVGFNGSDEGLLEELTTMIELAEK